MSDTLSPQAQPAKGLCSAVAPCPMWDCPRAGCRNSRARQLVTLTSPFHCHPVTDSSPLLDISCWDRNSDGKGCQGNISPLLLCLTTVRQILQCLLSPLGWLFFPSRVSSTAFSDIRKFLIFLELKGSVGLGWEEAQKPEKPFNPLSGPSEDRTPAWLPLMHGFRGHPEAQQGFTTAEHPKALYPGGVMCPSSFTSLFHSLLRRDEPS